MKTGERKFVCRIRRALTAKAATPFVLLALALVFSNCSAPRFDAPNAASSNAADAAASPNANFAKPPETPSLVLAKEAQNVNPNAFNAASDANLKVVRRNASGEKSTIVERAAPDDSVFSTTMNAAGQPVEIRTFKNHAELAKVERIWTSPKKSRFRIYLKSGKVVELAGDRLQNFAAEDPNNILVAAGAKKSGESPPPSAVKTEEN